MAAIEKIIAVLAPVGGEVASIKSGPLYLNLYIYQWASFVIPLTFDI